MKKQKIDTTEFFEAVAEICRDYNERILKVAELKNQAEQAMNNLKPINEEMKTLNKT